ncbi:MAG: gamma-glutamyl-gamma-aminobutyrate hydrolase family protein [Rubricella sp.]
MRPRIGVTVSRRSGWRIFPLMALNIWLAGGTAVRWQTGRDIDVSSVDGVLIGGGDDISPTLYGMELATTARLDPDRDEMEQAIAREAFARNKPVFGICRGSQMMNVVLGGTLHQDAYAVHPSRRYRTVLPRREVTVAAGSRLSRIVGVAPMKVNALHTQSVADLGDGLRIAAEDETGMVQAIERMRDPFALGVQWHPEHIFYARRQRALFRAFVAAARACADQRRQVDAVDAVADAEPVRG